MQRTSGLLSASADPSVAATGGFSPAFGAAAGVLFAGLLAFLAVRSRVAAPAEVRAPAAKTR